MNSQTAILVNIGFKDIIRNKYTKAKVLLSVIGTELESARL